MRERLLLRLLGLVGVVYGVVHRLVRTPASTTALSAPAPGASGPSVPGLSGASGPPGPMAPGHGSAARRSMTPVTRGRLLLGAVGVLVAAYGAFRILSQPDHSHPVALAVWLAVAVALHDGVLVPLTLLVGVVLTRSVPPRARRYVQGALVSAALVTAFTIPLAYRRGTATGVKALESQDYLANLGLVVAVIAVGAAVAYAVRVVRDRRDDRRDRIPGPRAAAAGDA